MPLNLDDKTNAYYRRLLVLDMSQQVSEKDKDPKLKDKLLEEVPYILYKCMNALNRLYTAGRFSVSEHSKACIEELYRAADSVKAFLDESICAKAGESINRSDMYKAYDEYCDENDRQAHGKAVFFRMLQDRGYVLKHTSKGYFYKDVAFVTDDFVEVDPETDVPFEQMELPLE